ncbi:MAG: HD domain-containing protein [Candidatus Babeliales bacterium]|nr:HD domain-containing protein [Candidatus Babeliales bacterium]
MNKLSQKLSQKIDLILDKNKLLKTIIQKIAEHNGKAILVGGAVRDLLLDIHIKDLDIEVHGLMAEVLEKILKSFGQVSLVGKSFGVFKLHGLDIDWSLPRTDSAGRKPNVEVDPFMSVQEAFRRRDITINAIGIDLVSHELLDPFNGQADLQKGILRATDKELFLQDPLRFYRVMQFIGRFEMQPDEELNNICANMNIANISRERIEEEFEKLFLKSKRPSLGIKWLDQINRLKEVLPEVYNLKNVPQEPSWHPEGDVFEHAMQAVDAAATFEYENKYDKLILVIAALCHDLGKATCTQLIDGKYRSFGHEVESEKIAKTLLARITNNIDLKRTVLKLVRYHMQPGALIKNKAGSAAYKRLAGHLVPYANMKMLSQLFLADRLGRNIIKGLPLPGPDLVVEEFVNKVKNLNIFDKPEDALLQGKDLIEYIKPGPQLGEILQEAYKLQIDDDIHDKEELKNIVLKKYLKK